MGWALATSRTSTRKVFRHGTPMAFLLFVLFAPAQVLADGLFQRLPKDGAWAKYKMTNELSGPSARASKRQGELKISCVGTVEVKGVRCRWIEIRDENRHLDGKLAYVYITKFLLPVDKLNQGHAAQQDIVRTWRKKGRSEPKLTSGPFPNSMRYLMYLPGETEDISDPKSSSGKNFVVNGRMIRSDEVRQQRATYEDDYHHVIDFQIWMSDSAPFGPVGASIKSSCYSGARLQWTFLRNYELVETGNGAVSELPDCN